jgi:hypothetical protein
MRKKRQKCIYTNVMICFLFKIKVYFIHLDPDPATQINADQFGSSGAATKVPIRLGSFKNQQPLPSSLPPEREGDSLWGIQNRARIWKRLRSPGIDSKESVFAGRYDNPILTRFLAPIDCSKIPAQEDNDTAGYDEVPNRPMQIYEEHVSAVTNVRPFDCCQYVSSISHAFYI